MGFRWGMLGLMAAGLSTGLAAEPATGVWAVSGREPGATAGYTGKVEIVPFGAYHQITWQTTRGVWEGFGQFVDGTFVCAWGEPGWYGFTLFALSGPGELRGDLAKRNTDNKVFTGQSEILNRVGDRKPGEDEFSGSFRVTGVQREIGDASIDYVGLIQITPKDGYYQLEW